MKTPGTGKPLHLAIRGGRMSFIAKGADVSANNNNGKTPLDWADGETIGLLRKHGGKMGEELKAEGK